MKELLYISAIAVAATVLLAVVLRHFDKPRVEAIRKLAKDCEYLGTPRDVNSVAFFDCNGVITIRRAR